jgi:hypothetical protein
MRQQREKSLNVEDFKHLSGRFVHPTLPSRRYGRLPGPRTRVKPATAGGRCSHGRPGACPFVAQRDSGTAMTESAALYDLREACASAAAAIGPPACARFANTGHAC